MDMRDNELSPPSFGEGVCRIDIWTYLHPSSSGFTWTKADGSLSSRIDLIGCPYIWVASVSACDILPCPFCDRCAFCVRP